MRTHVFTFRQVPPGGGVEAWIAEYAEEAVIRYGGGLQVVMEGDPLAFHFTMAWRGRYSAHHQFDTYHDQGTTHDEF